MSHVILFISMSPLADIGDPHDRKCSTAATFASEFCFLILNSVRVTQITVITSDIPHTILTCVLKSDNQLIAPKANPTVAPTDIHTAHITLPNFVYSSGKISNR